MEAVTVWILGVYFAIGAVGVWKIRRNNRTNPDAPGDGWKKYFVYLLIVNAVVWSMQNDRLFFALAILILLVGCGELISVWARSERQTVALLIAGMPVYALFAAGFLFFSADVAVDEQRFVYLLVFAFDGFSQIIGQLIGKRTIVKISPNKTLEGLLGGVLFTLITGLLLGSFLRFRLADSLGITLLIIAAAFAGDLLASFYKRCNGVKDYSALLPGHGGILDRFDSFIAAGSIYWILYLFPTVYSGGTGIVSIPENSSADSSRPYVSCVEERAIWNVAEPLSEHSHQVLAKEPVNGVCELGCRQWNDAWFSSSPCTALTFLVLFVSRQKEQTNLQS
jgi:phosphatidate cytidylyltransferase